MIAVVSVGSGVFIQLFFFTVNKNAHHVISSGVKSSLLNANDRVKSAQATISIHSCILFRYIE
jgi:hypothetical protein